MEQLLQKAETLSNQMAWKEFSEDDKRVIIVAKNDTQEKKDLLDLTYKVISDTSLSMDSTYLFSMEALEIIANASESNADDLGELSSNIEADIYISDLTAWLSESNNHIYYLTEALESGITDGFQALALAQVLAKTEVLDIVIRWLKENQS